MDYLISIRLGRPDRSATVLEDVARGGYQLETFGASDVGRAVEIMRQYADLRIGLADASNVVLAERLGTTDILTTDERHFRVLLGPDRPPFRLLPADRQAMGEM